MKKNLLILLFLIICSLCFADEPPKNHNEIYTCKNLLQKYTLDQLSVMISSGNFDDIYVGDYIEMEMTSDYGTEKVRWLVADIDYFYDTTKSLVDKHHIVLVAEDGFVSNHRMNSTNVTTGGFAGSEMFTTTLPKYDTAITNAFGASHVLSYNQSLSNSVGTSIPSMAGNNISGASNGWIPANGIGTNPRQPKLMLMSEPQLLGVKIISSSYRDISVNNRQFSIFKWLPEKIVCGRGFNAQTVYAYWLSAVVASNAFAYCNANGRMVSSGASGSRLLRPYFLFY